jgi:DNA-binding response OmpR family regulator
MKTHPAGLSVLVVDDEVDLCANAADIPGDPGFDVDTPPGASHLLARSPGFQVALIDVKLPNGSGPQLLQRIRAASPDIRIILITAHRSETDEVVMQAIPEGAEAVCYEPFDIPQLLKMIADPSNPPLGDEARTDPR